MPFMTLTLLLYAKTNDLVVIVAVLIVMIQNLTRAICFILWGEIFPDLTASDIGTGQKYRGDTLNTFNTVFGSYFPEQHSCVGIERSNASESLRVLANKFHAAYHSIGNFILLPNIAETDKSGLIR